MFLHESVHMVEKLRRGIIDFICFFCENLIKSIIGIVVLVRCGGDFAR